MIFFLWNVLCYYSGSLKMTGHCHQFLLYLGTEGHSVPSRCFHIYLSICFSQMAGITSDSHFGIHRKRTCWIEKQSGGCLLLGFFPFCSFPTMCFFSPYVLFLVFLMITLKLFPYPVSFFKHMGYTFRSFLTQLG